MIDGVITDRGSYSDELVVLILREAQIRKELQLPGCRVQQHEHVAPSIENGNYAVAMTGVTVPIHNSALAGGHEQHAVEIFDSETERMVVAADGESERPSDGR